MGLLAKKQVKLAPARVDEVTFEDDSGSSITISGMDVVQLLCPNATQQEVVFFMELCRSQRLNPFIREAFLVKYGSGPAQAITAEVVFERRANSHPAYRGMESGVVYLDASGSICHREGTATYSQIGETLIGGWARVHRSDRSDAYAEVSLDEYNKRKSVWQSMPGVMINKCAKAVALRTAFPSDFQGMYVEEELSNTPPIVDIAVDGAESELRDICDAVARLRGTERDDVMADVIGSDEVRATGYAGGRMSPIQARVAISVARSWLDSSTDDGGVPVDAYPESRGSFVDDVDDVQYEV